MTLDLLLPVTPMHGHVGPLVAIGRGLVTLGHRVTVLTGREHQPLVEANGLAFRELPEDCRADTSRADPAPWRPRVFEGRDAVIDTFITPLDAQFRCLTTELTRPGAHVDAVVADTAFTGALPLLLAGAIPERIPVLGVSVTPLAVVSVDAAPFGSALQPGSTEWSQRRNARINRMLRRGPLRALHEAFDGALAPYGVPPGRLDFFDHTLAFDATFQLSARSMEYPRRELPDTVSFVRPPAPVHERVPLPQWWSRLDEPLADDRGAGPAPIVHLTQGTLDNADLGRLIAPAIRGLADCPVRVVVSTGGRPVEALEQQLAGRLPANTLAAPFLPYAELLPRVAVMVTNGGYGGVQQALSHGIPLVVAGSTEDKPEVGARVAWAGVGIDLRRGTPSPRQVRRAVTSVLEDPAYRAAAARVATDIASLDEAAEAIAHRLDAMTTHPREVRSAT